MGRLEMLKDPKRASRPYHKKEKEIEIDDQRGPAGDPKAWDEPEKKCGGHTSRNNGFHHSHEITNIRISPGPSIKTCEVKDDNFSYKNSRKGGQIVIFHRIKIPLKTKPKGEVIREGNHRHIHKDPEDSPVYNGSVEEGEERTVAQHLNLTIAQFFYANIGGDNNGSKEKGIIDILEIDR